jgi:hypothetical protein
VSPGRERIVSARRFHIREFAKLGRRIYPLFKSACTIRAIDSAAYFLDRIFSTIFALSGPTTCHIHIEYYPNHFYIKQESIPLVITKCAAGDEARY